MTASTSQRNLPQNLPASIAQFVQDRVTIPLPDQTPEFPYSAFWWKAVSCALLSGRVRAKVEKGLPNRTDLDRLCKQANFDQFLFATIAEFLIASQIVKANQDHFEAGPRLPDFLSGDLRGLRVAAQAGVRELINRNTPFHSWRPAFRFDGVADFLRAFFRAIGEKALRLDDVGGVFAAFSDLPQSDLKSWLRQCTAQSENRLDTYWEPWLDDKGQAALVQALFTAGWAYTIEQDQRQWFCLSPTGAIMLGLADPPPAPPRVVDFKALADLRILAGVDLPFETLLVLFRHCHVLHLDRVLEFRLDKKVMQEVPTESPAAGEVLRVLAPCTDLPGTVRHFLGDQPTAGGTLHFLACRGLVRAADPNQVAVILAHPKLKGYFDPKAPPGCLVIKENSDPAAFLIRCKQFGFEVKPW
jgi:hypothetical protein